MSEYEFIKADEVTFVKRGRKSSASPELVKALGSLKVGSAMVVHSLATDPKSPDYAKAKARISSQIRSACKSAGLSDYEIRWSPTGVPQVVRPGK